MSYVNCLNNILLLQAEKCGMDFKFIIKRIKNIIINPVGEWNVIANEKDDYKKVINSFAVPVIIIISFAKFLGLAKYGINLSFASVLLGIINFVSYYFGIYLTSLITKEIAPTFLSANNKTIVFKVIVYSSIPIFVASFISNLAPSLFFVNLFFVYTLYLLWTGISPLMNTPEKHKMSLIIIIIVILFASIQAIEKILVTILPVSKSISL